MRSMLAAGQLLERYVVEDYVGHGGMAVVYRVRHADLGTLHALKVLTVPRPTVRERLLQEGRAQAALRHPNLVGVTDVLRIDGSLALVMEYVDGPDLGHWLARYRRGTIDECRALLRGICDGVGEAHAGGIAHRDLKPANVLLERTPTGFRSKVTDFGIAKLLEESSPTATRSNVAMGTPHYMAPEQIRDAAATDARADLFAIGAILYEVATGELAFPGGDVLTVLNAVAAGRFVPPKEHVPELPDDLVRAIEGCLVVDVDARLQTCDEVMGALEEPVPATARIARGLDLAAEAWEDAETRRAREEWLSSGPPASERRTQGPPSEEDTEVGPRPDAVTPVYSQQPRSEPPDTPQLAAPVSGHAPTVPRPEKRSSMPPASLPSAHPQSLAPPAVSLIRRLVISAIAGIVLGLLGFLLIVGITGWPLRQAAPKAPPDKVGLEEVVDPRTPAP